MAARTALPPGPTPGLAQPHTRPGPGGSWVCPKQALSTPGNRNPLLPHLDSACGCWHRQQEHFCTHHSREPQAQRTLPVAGAVRRSRRGRSPAAGRTAIPPHTPLPANPPAKSAGPSPPATHGRKREQQRDFFSSKCKPGRNQSSKAPLEQSRGCAPGRGELLRCQESAHATHVNTAAASVERQQPV